MEITKEIREKLVGKEDEFVSLIKAYVNEMEWHESMRDRPGDSFTDTEWAIEQVLKIEDDGEYSPICEYLEDCIVTCLSNDTTYSWPVEKIATVWITDEISGGSLFSEFGYDELASAELFADLYSAEVAKYMATNYPELEVNIDITARAESMVMLDLTTEDDYDVSPIAPFIQEISDRIFEDNGDDWAVKQL